MESDLTSLADLASARVGGRAVATNDDFFAPMSNLVKAEPAVFIPGKYTPRGKWMDGWESRRQRSPGHDWCVVELGIRGVIRGVNVDTRFFTGNYPSHCSLEAIDAIDASAPVPARRSGRLPAGAIPKKPTRAPEAGPWTTILDKVALSGDSENVFALTDSRPWTHVRLNIFPDGGVARLRVYGDAEIDWAAIARSKRVYDLASIMNGGLVLGASDMHFGAKGNLIMPGRAKNMGDGWETRRRRGPGHDWAVVRLGAPGMIRRIEIDTNHFKGNFPDRASIEGCFHPNAGLAALADDGWKELLPETKLRASHRHIYARELRPAGVVSHIRLNIFPDGGISRLRVHGTVAPD